MTSNSEILIQFFLDAPRIDIYLGETLCKNPEYILSYVQLNLNNNQKLIDILIHSLTQTFLASFYIKEYNKKIQNSEYLLDHNGYKIYVNCKDRNVNINKEFKLVYFDEDDCDNNYIVDYQTLNIILDLETNISLYYWSSEFNNDTIIIKS